MTSETTNRSAGVTALRHPLASFLASLRFLTILPIGWNCENDGEFFQGGLFYFTVIGALLGLCGAAIYYCIGPFFPAPVSSACMILFLGFFSGFLHYDGLADTCDGFFSSRPRERILEIMRDSRIGAMGVIAIFAVMMLKYAALSSLDFDGMVTAIFLMPIAGRAAIVVSMAILPYARKEEGLGILFYSENCRPAAYTAMIVLFVCASFFDFRTACILSGIFVGMVFLFSVWCKRVIGGATGDTLGGICEVCEMSIAVSLSCLYY